MCNLHSITTNQEAIRALFRVINRYVGNLSPMPGVFPNYPAPVVRTLAVSASLHASAVTPGAGGFSVTNIRSTLSPHWRAWLGSENRYLAPALVSGTRHKEARLV
jgi:putative SOS response-associated peptidase YedK